jgi:hypothetical protein
LPERGSGTLCAMKLAGKRQVSDEAQQLHHADTELAGQRPELLAEAERAESRFREAQARRAPVAEVHALALTLDDALTAAMQAAYAAQRAEIGARGYDDRIYRRKAKAKAAVHKLTLRETHRLNVIPDKPLAPVSSALAQ